MHNYRLVFAWEKRHEHQEFVVFFFWYCSDASGNRRQGALNSENLHGSAKERN